MLMKWLKWVDHMQRKMRRSDTGKINILLETVLVDENVRINYVTNNSHSYFSISYNQYFQASWVLLCPFLLLLLFILRNLQLLFAMVISAIPLNSGRKTNALKDSKCLRQGTTGVVQLKIWLFIVG